MTMTTTDSNRPTPTGQPGRLTRGTSTAGRRWAELPNGPFSTLTLRQPQPDDLAVHTGGLALMVAPESVSVTWDDRDAVGLVEFGSWKAWVRLYDQADVAAWRSALAWVLDGERS